MSTKNFSEAMVKVGDGITAEESGIASNQPGQDNDPKMTFDPTTGRWGYSNDGVASHPMGAAPVFATEAAAIAAGLDFVGASYFNTTDGAEYLYVSDTGLGVAGFLKKKISEVCFHARDTAGVAIPHNSTVTVPMNQVDFDSHNAYDSVTGIYTIPKDGKYLFMHSFGYNLTPLNTGTRYLAFSRVSHPGVAGGGSRSASANSTQAFNNSVGTFNSNILKFSAGDTLRPQAFQFNNELITLPSVGSTDTYFSIIKVG